MTSRQTRSRRPARAPAVRADDDPGGISEITILPDGRVYVLGLSVAVLEMLRQSGPWEGLSAARQPRLRAEPRRETGARKARQE
jgi:hypothetical protein